MLEADLYKKLEELYKSGWHWRISHTPGEVGILCMLYKENDGNIINMHTGKRRSCVSAYGQTIAEAVTKVLKLHSIRQIPDKITLP